MIYLFSGENNFLLQEELKKWKSVFIEKNSDFNFIHIKDLNEVDKNYLSEILLGQSFFGGKKFIIIEGYPLSASKKSESEDGDSENDSEIDSFFLQIFEKIPNENIVVFANNTPDKRSKVYKKLIEVSTLKEFPLYKEDELHSYLIKKYSGKITNEAIDLLIYYKSSNLEKIINDIEKLLLSTSKIELHDVKNNIFPEIEENIFILVDNILNKKIKEAIIEMKNMLNYINIYALYNSILANLRNRLYIEMLLHMHVSHSLISDKLGLGNKAFLVTKKYKIDYETLEVFYLDLIDIDKNMKFGKLMGSEEEDFLYELEKTMIKHLS